VKILSVNHTASISGAERSLLDLLGALGAEDAVRIACPSPGALPDAARARAIPTARLPQLDASLRLNPRSLTVGLAQLARACGATVRRVRRHRPDVVHANSIRAGLFAIPAAKLTGVPCVVHLRDRLPRSRAADASLHVIGRWADVVVANSHYTAAGLQDVVERGDVQVVPNPVDLARFTPAAPGGRGPREAFGIDGAQLRLGIVGQVTPWKGQLDAVRIVEALGHLGVRAGLVIVGEAKFVAKSTRYDNAAYADKIRREIDRAQLTTQVILLGERDDVPEIMSSLDVLLVPSWQEPFGRVVIEGMAQGIVVAATSVGGPAEIITDGVDGLLLAPREPDTWARALAELASDPARRERMVEQAAARAHDFALPLHVEAMRRVFDMAMSSCGTMA
jgi:glycosyltransferase involved in cell wall biosynthesis